MFGKGSRSRVEDVLAIFGQRYLIEPGVADDALAKLVQAQAPANMLTPIFYFHSAQNDDLLHGVVIDFLVQAARTRRPGGTVQANVDGTVGERAVYLSRR